MDRGDDDVELSEAVVGEIEAAVAEDVALDSCEQREVLEASVQCPNASGVFQRASSRRGRWPWRAPCCGR